MTISKNILKNKVSHIETLLLGLIFIALSQTSEAKLHSGDILGESNIVSAQSGEILTHGQCVTQTQDRAFCDEAFSLMRDFGIQPLFAFSSRKQCMRIIGDFAQCKQYHYTAYNSVKQCMRHSGGTHAECKAAMQLTFNSIKQCLRFSTLTRTQCKQEVYSSLESYDQCVTSSGPNCTEIMRRASQSVAQLTVEVPAACMGTINNHCPNSTGVDAQMSCLESHQSALNDSCRSALGIESSSERLQVVEIGGPGTT